MPRSRCGRSAGTGPPASSAPTRSRPPSSPARSRASVAGSQATIVIRRGCKCDQPLPPPPSPAPSAADPAARNPARLRSTFADTPRRCSAPPRRVRKPAPLRIELQVAHRRRARFHRRDLAELARQRHVKQPHAGSTDRAPVRPPASATAVSTSAVDRNRFTWKNE